MRCPEQKAFCDVYDDGKNDGNNTIYKNLNRSARQVAVRKKGMWMTATIESHTSPLFQAHFNLDGAHRRNLGESVGRAECIIS
ncbi:hypothetical protein Tco_1274730 [Tanacetum coccineum]